jgi:hypothetical protein
MKHSKTRIRQETITAPTRENQPSSVVFYEKHASFSFSSPMGGPTASVALAN